MRFFNVIERFVATVISKKIWKYQIVSVKKKMDVGIYEESFVSTV